MVYAYPNDYTAPSYGAKSARDTREAGPAASSNQSNIFLEPQVDSALSTPGVVRSLAYRACLR